MKIHKEGYKTLRNQIIIYFLIALITLFNHNFFYYITPIFLVIFIFSLYFFRIPKILFERKEGKIYSPCDGKVVVIEETTENEYYKDKRVQISVFMSPLNIHNNLYPTSGKIKYLKYHAGRFLVAWNPKASTDNERNSIVLENKKISILIRQIAGAVARRIVSYSNIEESVKVADELGFIKFGSRVDLFLPIGTKINVKINQKVSGGKSILATY
mgnify:CR=1 FL=1